MLVRITHQCHMLCSHCFIQASPNGPHMSLDTFEKVLRFIPEFVILSGGEPTEHPQILEILNLLKANGVHVLLLSNGVFLHGPLKNAVLDRVDCVQITNDPRFYPQHVHPVAHERILWETHIRSVFPIGRALTNGIPPTRLSPSCFNLRSLTKHFKDVRFAINALRVKGKFCTPSINIDGTISSGELHCCEPIGSVTDSLEKITDNIRTLRCRKCGLYKNLTSEQLEVFES